MQLPIGLLIFLAIVTPWYYLVQQANPDFLHFFFVTQQVTRFMSAAEFNNPSPFWFYVPIILIGFYPWTAFIAQSIYRGIKSSFSKYADGSEWFLVLWFFTVLIFFSIPRSKTIGYILPVFPPIALLVGRYLALSWETALRRRYLEVCLFALLCVIFAVILILINVNQWVDVSSHFAPYLVVITVALLAAGAIATGFIPKLNQKSLFALCAACNIIFLLTLTKGAHHLNQASAKPLITRLETMRTPDDTIVNYFKFYQDVPLYLGQRIQLVADWKAPDIAERDNWKRELWYGMSMQKSNPYLVNEDDFWREFKGKRRVFVFLNENYLDQFRSHTRHFHIIQKHNDIYLITNHRPASFTRGS